MSAWDSSSLIALSFSEDDIVAATGPRVPELEPDTDYTLLMVLAVGPTDVITPDQLDALADHRSRWTSSWPHFTGDRSTVDFALTPEGFELPPAPAEPALVPEGAW